MALLLGIDDTDTVDSELGTGRVARRLAAELAAAVDGLDRRGVVRQQFLLDPRVPYTTHNSSATLVFDCETDDEAAVVEVAADFLVEVAADGSDPGLCVAESDDVPESAVAFGRRAQAELVEKADAYAVAREADLFLAEYGGTGDGVIGALGGLALTAAGDSGRFVAYGDIREYGATVSVETLRADGIRVVAPDGTSVDSGTVETRNWIRPQLREGVPTLPVERDGEGGAWLPANRTD